MGEDTPRRRYLDQPFVLQLVALEDIADQLRPLTHHNYSPLPQRMRTELSRMFLRVRALTRELRNRPDAVLQERADEDRP